MSLSPEDKSMMIKFISIAKGMSDCQTINRQTNYGVALMLHNEISKMIINIIIIELSIKSLWMLDKQSANFRKSHNIWHLFNSLSEKNKGEIKNIYDACVKEYVEFWAEQDIDSMADIGNRMATLENALIWNESAMKNFKYDPQFSAENIPVENFALQLVNYAFWKISSSIDMPPPPQPIASVPIKRT